VRTALAPRRETACDTVRTGWPSPKAGEFTSLRALVASAGIMGDDLRDLGEIEVVRLAELEHTDRHLRQRGQARTPL
jgi:hypothetical protein